mgnify:CR=1 FL=1
MSVSTVVIIILTLLLGVSVFYSIKFALIILKVQDAIEESLDILDERYSAMSKVLDIPLFHDSPEIKRVVEDIRISRDTILVAAQYLASIDVEAVASDTEDIEETSIGG